MSVLAVVAACGFVVFSLFWAVLTDPCSNTGTNCNDALLYWAWAVVWGGAAIAVIGGASGIIIAAVRRRVMWIWPTLALGLTICARAAPGRIIRTPGSWVLVGRILGATTDDLTERLAKAQPYRVLKNVGHNAALLAAEAGRHYR